VTEGKLKVMLESDYVAMSHQKDMAESSAPAGDVAMSHQKDMAESSAPAGDVAMSHLENRIQIDLKR